MQETVQNKELLSFISFKYRDSQQTPSIKNNI